MLLMFIIFLLFLYIICGWLKWERIRSIKLKIPNGKRLYNEPMVFIKAVLLMIDTVLLIIYIISDNAVLEKSGGIKGILIMAIPFLIFYAVSIKDMKKVIDGYNDELYQSVGISVEEDD